MVQETGTTARTTALSTSEQNSITSLAVLPAVSASTGALVLVLLVAYICYRQRLRSKHREIPASAIFSKRTTSDRAGLEPGEAVSPIGEQRTIGMTDNAARLPALNVSNQTEENKVVSTIDEDVLYEEVESSDELRMPNPLASCDLVFSSSTFQTRQERTRQPVCKLETTTPEVIEENDEILGEYMEMNSPFAYAIGDDKCGREKIGGALQSPLKWTDENKGPEFHYSETNLLHGRCTILVTENWPMKTPIKNKEDRDAENI